MEPAPPPGPESLPALTRAARTLGLFGVEALSVGFAVWLVFSHEILPEYFHANELAEGQRHFVFADMGAALGLTAVIILAILVWKRRAGLPVLGRLARRASPLALLWLVPFVFDRRLWDGQDLLVLPIVVAAGWALVVAIRAASSTEPAFPGLARRIADWGTRIHGRLTRQQAVVQRIVTPKVVVLLAAAAYGVYFSAFTITSHKNLGTHGFDLGLEENLLWHTLRRGLPLFRSTIFSGPTGTHFGNHATFFAYVIAPIYALAPHPETLLVVQAFLMGAAAIPLYLYGSRHLPPWTAALVACAYLLFPPMNCANLYDFHYLPLGVFFVWLTLYAVEANKRALAVVSVVLALSVREDVAACLSVVGLFLLLTGAAARAGAVIAALAGGYFVLMKLFLMPLLGGTEAFVFMFGGMVPREDSGFAGVLKTFVANPGFTANVIFDRDKVTYLCEVLAPVMLLPLTRPVGFLFVAPGLVFTLLSTGYWPLIQPSFQYTSYWTTFAFIGVVVALEHAGRPRYSGDDGGPSRRGAITAGFVAVTLACSYLGGGILQREDVRAGFGRVSFKTTADDLRNRRDLAMLLRNISPDDKVVASNRLAAHIATRDYAYTLNQGTYDADWLLFEGEFVDNEREIVLQSLTDGPFGVVEEQGTFVLAKRDFPKTANLPVVTRIVR